jgi:hypothetical protein
MFNLLWHFHDTIITQTTSNQLLDHTVSLLTSIAAHSGTCNGGTSAARGADTNCNLQFSAYMDDKLNSCHIFQDYCKKEYQNMSY